MGRLILIVAMIFVSVHAGAAIISAHKVKLAAHAPQIERAVDASLQSPGQVRLGNQPASLSACADAWGSRSWLSHFTASRKTGP